MQTYNPTKYRWERDPNGKYAYGATCVRECPEHLLKDNGACVRACPEKKKVRITSHWSRAFALLRSYWSRALESFMP